MAQHESNTAGGLSTMFSSFSSGLSNISPGWPSSLTRGCLSSGLVLDPVHLGEAYDAFHYTSKIATDNNRPSCFSDLQMKCCQLECDVIPSSEF